MSAVGVVLNNDSDIHYFTVNDNASIDKGSLIVLTSDPRTATAHSGLNRGEVPLGIAVMDKVSGDGSTTIAVRTRGIVDMVADGAITLGDLVAPGSAANDVTSIAGADWGSGQSMSIGILRNVIGRCLETASDNEVVAIKLML